MALLAGITILCAALVGPRAAYAAEECDQGGYGAESCSLSGNPSCNVSCQNEYYACCKAGDPPTCQCIAAT